MTMGEAGKCVGHDAIMIVWQILRFSGTGTSMGTNTNLQNQGKQNENG